MNKISVFGPTGSGKSFVAGELSKIFNLPIIYFDHYSWNPDMSPVDKDIFVERILSMAGDKWIMDGNHSRDDELTRYRFTESGLIVFLEPKIGSSKKPQSSKRLSCRNEKQS